MRVLLPRLIAALLGIVVVPAFALQLSFGSVRLDPARDLPTAPDYAAGPHWRLLQFEHSPTQAQRDALTAQGLRVVQYYPENTYLAWGDAAAMQRSSALPSLRWAGDLRTQWKRSPDLQSRSGRIDQVQLLLYNDGRLAEHQAEIEGIGARIISSAKAQPDGALWQLVLSVDADALPQLQALAPVLWLEYASPQAGLDDEAADQIVAGNYAQDAPIGPGYLGFLGTLGLDGSGVSFAVTDTGIDYAQPELGPRIVGGRDYPGCSSAAGQPGDDHASGGHGTHVAGILGGAGMVPGAVDADGYHHGLGVAPGVSLVALNPICGSGGSWPPPEGWQDLSRQALLLGAIGSNNSWNSGESNGLGYQASARAHDFMVRDGDFELAGNQGFVMVFSAGNAGPSAGSISAPKEAKNLIVVGNALGTRPTPQIDSISPTSSRGPALDGRILPTLVAPGNSIASTRRIGGANYCARPIADSGPNLDYALCSGTSMAAPHVAGLAVLLTQDWRLTHGGSSPSPAMLKALLVNGAVDMAGPPPVPNNTEGWGRANLRGSLGGGLPRTTRDQSDLLDDPAQEFLVQYTVPQPDQPVRLTLAWTDAPGAPGANPALVNDLDLIVQTRDGSYQGNVLVQGGSVDGGHADTLNNIENVFLHAGAADLLSVRVRASALPGDGVPGVGDETDQDFALVCSNCSSAGAFSVNMANAPAALCQGQVLQRSLSVVPLLDFDAPVALSVLGWPASGSASYNPTAIASLPGSTLLSLDSNGVAAGEYYVNAGVSSGELERSIAFSVHVADQLPQVAELQLPAPGATEVGNLPMLRWATSAAAFDYQVQIASDERFNTIVASTVTRLTRWNLTTPLAPATRYYWRVLARNACVSADLFADRFEDLPLGAGTPSATAQFTTAP